MSRCFPFPPPGYERQHILEDLILPKEAKHKEKKDKKDKDRKKDKKKKEKDGSEKHRDKKDRKGKHKDKKEERGDKKKDKDDGSKDKEKSSISEESTVAGKLKERNGEKVHPEVQNKYSSVEDGGKCSTLLQGQNGKSLQNTLPSKATKEARFMQELDGRIRDNEKGRGNQFLHRLPNAGTRDQEATAGTAFSNPSQVLVEEKHNGGDKSFQGKKFALQGRNGEFIRKETVQNLSHGAESKNEGIHRPLKEHDALRLDEDEKYKQTGGNKHGDRRKDGDKKNHGKDKHMEKLEEKKKEGKANKVNIENEKTGTEKSRISGRNYVTVAACNRGVNVLKEGIGTTIDEGSSRKRRDIHANGYLHESEIRPNKVQKLALHQSTENVRKLEASSKFSSDKHAVLNNGWLDHHDRLNNGIIEAKKPSPSKPNPSSIDMLSNQIVVSAKTRHPDVSSVNEALRMPKKDQSAEASKRPPHPDSKYLNQILTVPNVGNWFEDDDQDWLFCKKDPPNEPVLEPIMATEEIHVWAEAVHIESADVCALPYVIPY